MKGEKMRKIMTIFFVFALVTCMLCGCASDDGGGKKKFNIAKWAVDSAVAVGTLGTVMNVTDKVQNFKKANDDWLDSDDAKNIFTEPDGYQMGALSRMVTRQNIRMMLDADSDEPRLWAQILIKYAQLVHGHIRDLTSLDMYLAALAQKYPEYLGAKRVDMFRFFAANHGKSRPLEDILTYYEYYNFYTYSHSGAGDTFLSRDKVYLACDDNPYCADPHFDVCPLNMYLHISHLSPLYLQFTRDQKKQILELRYLYNCFFNGSVNFATALKKQIYYLFYKRNSPATESEIKEMLNHLSGVQNSNRPMSGILNEYVQHQYDLQCGVVQGYIAELMAQGGKSANPTPEGRALAVLTEIEMSLIETSYTIADEIGKSDDINTMRPKWYTPRYARNKTLLRRKILAELDGKTSDTGSYIDFVRQYGRWVFAHNDIVITDTVIYNHEADLLSAGKGDVYRDAVITYLENHRCVPIFDEVCDKWAVKLGCSIRDIELSVNKIAKINGGEK